MALAIVHSRASLGVEAPLVTVETHLSNGLPGFSIVGLPETVVKESKERVRSAILNSRFDFPARRITVNLAPADLPKAGGRFDLAIALGILIASGQIKADALSQYEFMSELALSGELRSVSGLLPGLLACHQQQRIPIVAAANHIEAGMLKQKDVFLAGHLLEVCAHLKDESELPKAEPTVMPPINHQLDMANVRGQHHAKRALIIAAAGNHNLLFSGPPGTGKTLLASCLPSILPELEQQQAIEVAALHTMTGKGQNLEFWKSPPFRAPHHTASAVALVGGGSHLNPGEISLAHNGVLFLDELPEFGPKVLEVMREPMESGEIVISRANYQVRLPARFQLLAAMNPCPCGYLGDTQKACRCSIDRIEKYQQRVSGPLLDRIDLHVQVPRLSETEQQELMASREEKASGESSKEIRKQVIKVREIQLARQQTLNGNLDQVAIQKHCKLNEENKRLLQQASNKLSLSIRAYFRILKVARTIADLESGDRVERRHLLEALGFRSHE